MNTVLMNPTENAVLQTLAYFEQFERALTIEELHQFLWDKAVFQSGVQTIVSDLRKQKLVVMDDYIGLSKSSVASTKERQELLMVRRAKALRIASTLQQLPGVHSVILINSSALQTLTRESDIDFLLITESDSLYISCTLAIPHLELRRLMKSSHRQAGKACLGYWVTEHDLELHQYQTEMHSAAYWLASMVPLSGYAGYTRLIAENSWVHQYLPNWTMHEVAHLPELPPYTWSGAPLINRLLWPLHRAKVMADPTFRNSSEMVCTLDRLKLHSIDQRPEYGQKMQSILDILLQKH